MSMDPMLQNIFAQLTALQKEAEKQGGRIVFLEGEVKYLREKLTDQGVSPPLSEISFYNPYIPYCMADSVLLLEFSGGGELAPPCYPQQGSPNKLRGELKEVPLARARLRDPASVPKEGPGRHHDDAYLHSALRQILPFRGQEEGEGLDCKCSLKFEAHLLDAHDQVFTFSHPLVLVLQSMHPLRFP